jgi:hypothetical protein
MKLTYSKKKVGEKLVLNGALMPSNLVQAMPRGMVVSSLGQYIFCPANPGDFYESLHPISGLCKHLKLGRFLFIHFIFLAFRCLKISSVAFCFASILTSLKF